MNEQHAKSLIRASLDKLKNNDMLDKAQKFTDDMILLGVGSPLDSIGFVTFVTDLEERISTEANKDLYLVLNEIHEFNINQPHLNIGHLAKYIVQLSEGAK